ncbi:MAG: hypothetical protein G4V63_32160 [Candidatus Afipia apatlaquensis]|uniref:Uncharacterized protein n=1 Tax=Candidatus Afipia apatlaquensis TaxID=2712852 RepID=A0A7C9RP83_9BRAD|nr:hypothetical protein [Candidatus Afipia apatlaquensis]
MNRMSGSDWMSDGKKAVYDKPAQASEEFEYQQGKPVKALIGIALLAVLAVALARMHPAPHDVSNTPATTTGQTTGTSTR